MAQPQSLFRGAVETVRRLADEERMPKGYTFRGEVISAPRHNKLTYERVPFGNIVLFDVQIGGEYGPRGLVNACASALGLEAVQLLAPPGRYSPADIEKLVEGPSQLGGAREGVVIKRAAGGPDRMKAKVVGNLFKEKMGVKPSKGSDIQQIVEMYRTEPRWEKAVQHLRDEGRLSGSPKDIGPLLGEVARDLKEECENEIREVLWPKIWKQITKGVSLGLAEFYLEKLKETE